MDIVDLIEKMTLKEKASIVAGTNFMNTCPVIRLDIPSVEMADGPHGLRKQEASGDNGIETSLPATAFPTAVTLACGWSERNAQMVGEAIAKECLHYGVSVLLGPGANIKRNPLCGRNFEYFSEDPYLSGVLAAGEIRGIQSQGVNACVKHFALNNAEDYRFMGNSVCDMRAMREIYLRSFEIAVKEGKPSAVMSAYNQINGVFCSENEWLLRDVLRGEWGFDGLVMTDWGGTHDRVLGIKAGCDLEMPGDTAYCAYGIEDAVKGGALPIEKLNLAVGNVLTLAKKRVPYVCDKQDAVLRSLAEAAKEVDFDAHNALSASIAADCAVLLKNQSALPLDKTQKILVYGEMFEKMRYQGAGSSMINPTCVTTPKNAFDVANIDYTYISGDKLDTQAIRDFDKILVFAGLDDECESEGADRQNLSLPQSQLKAINALIATGKKIIVVLFGGGVMELPFEDSVDAILYMALPGQNGGTAVKELIFGEKMPSGRLAETWVKSYADVPFGDSFSKTENEIYMESVFVGYRYYSTVKKQVRYPFGFGLSYTSFEYSNLKIEKSEKTIVASFTLENTGNFDGAEVAQVYIAAPSSEIFKPMRELRAFKKMYLKRGESAQVRLECSLDDLKYFDVARCERVLESGEYIICVCSDCLTVKLSQTVNIDGEQTISPYSKRVREAYASIDINKITDEIFCKMSGLKIPQKRAVKPVTMESPFVDLKNTFFGKIIYRSVIGVAKSKLKKAKKLHEGSERENAIKGALFMERILQRGCLRSMSMSAGARMPYNVALALCEIANGHIFRAIKLLCKK